MIRKTFAYIASLTGLALVLSSCYSLRPLVDDDVYVMKSTAIPVGESLTDPTSYATYRYKANKRRGITSSYYNGDSPRDRFDQRMDWFGSPFSNIYYFGGMYSGGFYPSSTYFGYVYNPMGHGSFAGGYYNPFVDPMFGNYPGYYNPYNPWYSYPYTPFGYSPYSPYGYNPYYNPYYGYGGGYGYGGNGNGSYTSGVFYTGHRGTTSGYSGVSNHRGYSSGALNSPTAPVGSKPGKTGTSIDSKSLSGNYRAPSSPKQNLRTRDISKSQRTVTSERQVGRPVNTRLNPGTARTGSPGVRPSPTTTTRPTFEPSRSSGRQINTRTQPSGNSGLIRSSGSSNRPTNVNTNNRRSGGRISVPSSGGRSGGSINVGGSSGGGRSGGSSGGARTNVGGRR